jgi:hypothetical protein
MVGQVCEGFLPDSGTEQLFRVAMEPSLPDDLDANSPDQSAQRRFGARFSTATVATRIS